MIQHLLEASVYAFGSVFFDTKTSSSTQEEDVSNLGRFTWEESAGLDLPAGLVHLELLIE